LRAVQIRCTLAWRADYKPDEITAADIEEQSKTGKVIERPGLFLPFPNTDVHAHLSIFRLQMYFTYEYSKQRWPIVYMKLERDQGNDRVTKVYNNEARLFYADILESSSLGLRL